MLLASYGNDIERQNVVPLNSSKNKQCLSFQSDLYTSMPQDIKWLILKTPQHTLNSLQIFPSLNSGNTMKQKLTRKYAVTSSV